MKQTSSLEDDVLEKAFLLLFHLMRSSIMQAVLERSIFKIGISESDSTPVRLRIDVAIASDKYKLVIPLAVMSSAVKLSVESLRAFFHSGFVAATFERLHPSPDASEGVRVIFDSSIMTKEDVEWIISEFSTNDLLKCKKDSNIDIDD